MIRAEHPELGDVRLDTEASATLLFCDNETNPARIPGAPAVSAYPKDAHQRLRRPRRGGCGQPGAPWHQGRRASRARAGPRGQRVGPAAPVVPAAHLAGAAHPGLGDDFAHVLDERRREADAFYATLLPPSSSADEGLVMRQALAGLLWGKQYYEYDVHRWLADHGVNLWNAQDAPASVRNAPWFHLVARDVISMPDPWEYPWFAAWDLAFHTRTALAGRRRLRQAAGRVAARHALPAPERADPGLRVELLRRQPAGAPRGRRCMSTNARPRSAAPATASSCGGCSRAC